MQRVVTTVVLGFGILCVCACESAPVVMVGEDGLLVRANSAGISADDTMAPAFDPRLDGFESVELSFRTSFATGAACVIELSRDDVSIGVLDGVVEAGACTAPWDGRGLDGDVLSPGVVDMQATLSRWGAEDVARSTIEVLRVGISEVQLASAGRASLLYARLDGMRHGWYELDAESTPWRMAPDAAEAAGATALALADGSARERPAIWEDTGSPPLDDASADGVEHDTFNLPTAFVAGSSVDGTLVLSAAGEAARDEGTGAGVEIRIVAPDGLALLDPGVVVDGAAVRFEAAASPTPAVGRYDVSWAWRFEARAPGGEWTALPGTFETSHRLYGLVAQPIFDYSDVPHRAWVNVVDDIAGWVDGATSDPAAVGAAIVEGVFYEFDLHYDNVQGASHYTDYGRAWRGASFELSRFYDLANGTIINCSDAAAIVSTYANMVGIDLRYHIIQHQWRSGFELNYLHAIGRDFGPSPFLSGRSMFRYHAVTGPPDTHIFDATLALDGDGEPGAAPNELLLVQDLTQENYLMGLTPEYDEVNVFIDEKVRIR